MSFRKFCQRFTGFASALRFALAPKFAFAPKFTLAPKFALALKFTVAPNVRFMLLAACVVLQPLAAEGSPQGSHGGSYARPSTAGPRPKLELTTESRGSSGGGAGRLYAPAPTPDPAKVSKLKREREKGKAMQESQDGDLQPGQFEMISSNGGITRALCPYTCAMRGIPKGSCRMWHSQSDPTRCYVQDLRLPSDAIPLTPPKEPVD